MVLVVFTLKQALWVRQLLVSIIFSLSMIHVVIPAYAAVQQQPVREAGLFARSLSQPVVMWKHNMPSFSVYLQKVVPIREPKPGEIVFTGLEHATLFPDATLLFSKGGVVLLQLPITTTVAPTP